MKLLISKNEEDILVKVKKDTIESEFNYITFVDDLCSGEGIEEIVYSDGIVEWEKDKINDLIDKIKEAIIIDEEEIEEHIENPIDFGIVEELTGKLVEESEIFGDTVEQ
ncbi:MAG: hypothetical protein WDA12_04050 [Bacilli bacterium]